jgi:hypothetical protein
VISFPASRWGEYPPVGSGRAAGRMGGWGRRAVADAGGSCHDGGQGPAARAGHAPGRGLRRGRLGVHRRRGHRAGDLPATIVVPGDPPGDRRQPGHVGRADRGPVSAMRPLRAASTESVSCAKGMGSQTGSQCRQTPGHTRRQPAMVSAARLPIRPHPATCSNVAYAPENRKVGGWRTIASGVCCWRSQYRDTVVGFGGLSSTPAALTRRSSPPGTLYSLGSYARRTR